MKQINLANWRNTKDNSSFNKFKLGLFISFAICVLLVIALILPLNFYKKTLLSQEKQQNILLQTNKTKIQEYLNFLQQNNASLQLLTIFQNNKAMSESFFRIFSELGATGFSVQINHISKIADKVRITGFALDEAEIQSWIKALQNSKYFINPRLVDFNLLEASENPLNTNQAIFAFSLEFEFSQQTQTQKIQKMQEFEQAQTANSKGGANAN